MTPLGFEGSDGLQNLTERPAGCPTRSTGRIRRHAQSSLSRKSGAEGSKPCAICVDWRAWGVVFPLVSLVSVSARNWCYICGRIERVETGEIVEIASIHAGFMQVAENMVGCPKRLGEYPTTLT